MPLPLLAALTVPAAVQGIAGLFGKKSAAKGSREAARIQAEAADKAAESAKSTAGDVSKSITEAGDRASAGITAASDEAAAGVTAASEGAATGVEQATGEANDVLRGVYEEALGLTETGRNAGNEATRTLSDLAQNPEEFTFDEDDPGFQFQLEQGNKALLRARAAMGGLQTGGTGQELLRFNQRLASTFRNNEFNIFDKNRKFRAGILDRLITGGERSTAQQLRASSEFGGRTSQNLTEGARVSGGFRLRGSESAGDFGVRGAATAGGFELNAAQSAGDAELTGEQLATNAALGGANAQAAGKVGEANAMSRFLRSLGDTASNIGSSLVLRDALKPAGGG